MTVEAERLQIIAEREALKRRYEEDDARLRADLVARLSVKDRLMRRLQVETVKHILKDDIGEFTIETRLMPIGEIQRALELDRMYTSGDAEKMMEAHSGFGELLDEICVTPGLGGGFWSSPECPAEPAVKAAIVARTAVASADIGRRISSFRDNV
jgi:hypothetical protein